MNYRRLLPFFAVGLLAACDSSEPENTQDANTPGAAAAPPAAPSAEVRAALEGQMIGKKLLGKTVQLVGDAFQPTDPSFAPEAYFVYYSASW